MIYRKNPKNGDEISQLSFGCMRLPRRGASIDIARSAEIIHSAIEKGVNYFDTAYIYPGSEAALGQILVGEWRKKVNIATKMPLFLVHSGADYDKYFKAQLERLKTDYIDYYMLHMLTGVESLEKQLSFGIEAWAKNEKERGRIKNFGFSYHGRQDHFKQIIDMYDWDFCQIQYNYIDENYQAGTAGLKYAHEKGLPVVVMEPLRGGKLVTGLPNEAVEIFKKVDHKRSLAEWGLRWLWNLPEVTTVLSGMSNEAQTEENIRIASDAEVGAVTEAEKDAYKKAVAVIKKSIKVDCTGCAYCMPCPAGVDIPHCFSRYNDSVMISRTHNIFSYVMSAGVFPAKSSFASQCKRCGKCEKHCPQNIAIMDRLADSAKYLEPFWAKPVASIAKRFTGGKSAK